MITLLSARPAAAMASFAGSDPMPNVGHGEIRRRGGAPAGQRFEARVEIAGSAALNAGNPSNSNALTSCLSTDARGLSRTTSCDIGAYELEATSVPTMNEWGMMIFMALAGIGSVYYLRTVVSGKYL